MQAWDMLLWVVVAMEVLTVCLLLIAGVAVVGRINRWTPLALEAQAGSARRGLAKGRVSRDD